MNPDAAAIPGVTWGSVDRHADERGSFRELWRSSRLPEPFVQVNLSTSAPGVLRGLHLHRRQVDHWVVASGRPFVALVDVRPLLEGRGSRPVVESRELPADARRRADEMEASTYSSEGGLAPDTSAEEKGKRRRPRRKRRPRADVIATLRTPGEGEEPEAEAEGGAVTEAEEA